MLRHIHCILKEKTMQRKRWVLLSIITMLVLVIASGTPTMADPDKDEARGKEHRQGRDDRKYREGWDDRRHHERRSDWEHHERHGHQRHHDGHSYFHQHGYTQLDIPPGHLPPPGACRVWYPGIPPGHQPPPGPCGRLRHRVPAGAWLMQRPADTPAYVDIEAYDTSRPGIVLDIGVFEVDTGAFIRVRPR
jgi:Ni/Co efflux regulator RcnB